MKKLLRALCFVVLVVAAIFVIGAAFTTQFVAGDLSTTIRSAGVKVLNVSAQVFNKITDLARSYGKPIWDAYINHVFNKVTPIFVTGLWYEVLVKIAGLLAFLILVTGIFKFVATQRRDAITGSTPRTIHVLGFIWLLFCAIVCASLIGGLAVFGGRHAAIPDRNFNNPDFPAFKTVDNKTTDEAPSDPVAAKAVNDAPKFTSSPVTRATAGQLYTYDVNAIDQDAGDKLTYSLILSPTGMTIDADTGLIQWTPADAQTGSHDVIVKVKARSSVSVPEVQFFTVHVDKLNK